MRTLNWTLCALLLGLLAIESTGVEAETWPTRPIKLVVPLVAGTTGDIVARSLADHLTNSLGQPVIVENRAGANGVIATASLAHAAPDGYTLGMAAQGTLVFNQGLYQSTGYDSVKDFAPVSLLGSVANVMVVSARNTAGGPMDIVAEAKRRPGRLNYSSGGTGTSHHMSGVLFARMAQVDIQHVPYAGAPQGIVAIISGDVDVGFYNMPTVIGQVRAGKLKALAVTSKERSPLLPNVPTLDTAGIPGYEVTTWFGLIAPARTPGAIVKRLNEEVSRYLDNPAVRAKMSEQGFELADPGTPEVFGGLVSAELAKWLPIIHDSGARVE